MKVYYFTVIAIGLMFTLFLAGVNTNSSMILNAVGGTGKMDWHSSSFWVFVIGTISAFVILISVNIGGYGIQKSTEAVTAVFMALIYTAFAGDLFSVLSKVGEITNYTGWQYWVVWAIIVPLLGGYGLSIIEWIRGTD
jgi:hypothetical protein